MRGREFTKTTPRVRTNQDMQMGNHHWKVHRIGKFSYDGDSGGGDGGDGGDGGLSLSSRSSHITSRVENVSPHNHRNVYGGSHCVPHLFAYHMYTCIHTHTHTQSNADDLSTTWALIGWYKLRATTYRNEATIRWATFGLMISSQSDTIRKLPSTLSLIYIASPARLVNRYRQSSFCLIIVTQLCCYRFFFVVDVAVVVVVVILQTIDGASQITSIDVWCRCNGAVFDVYLFIMNVLYCIYVAILMINRSNQ